MEAPMLNYGGGSYYHHHHPHHHQQQQQQQQQHHHHHHESPRTLMYSLSSPSSHGLVPEGEGFMVPEFGDMMIEEVWQPDCESMGDEGMLVVAPDGELVYYKSDEREDEQDEEEQEDEETEEGEEREEWEEYPDDGAVSDSEDEEYTPGNDDEEESLPPRSPRGAKSKKSQGGERIEQVVRGEGKKSGGGGGAAGKRKGGKGSSGGKGGDGPSRRRSRLKSEAYERKKSRAKVNRKIIRERFETLLRTLAVPNMKRSDKCGMIQTAVQTIVKLREENRDLRKQQASQRTSTTTTAPHPAPHSLPLPPSVPNEPMTRRSGRYARPGKDGGGGKGGGGRGQGKVVREQEEDMEDRRASSLKKLKRLRSHAFGGVLEGAEDMGLIDRPSLLVTCFLDPQSLERGRSVSCLWSKVHSHYLPWKELCAKRWNLMSLTLEEIAAAYPGMEWRELYIHQHRLQLLPLGPCLPPVSSVVARHTSHGVAAWLSLHRLTPPNGHPPQASFRLVVQNLYHDRHLLLPYQSFALQDASSGTSTSSSGHNKNKASMHQSLQRELFHSVHTVVLGAPSTPNGQTTYKRFAPQEPSQVGLCVGRFEAVVLSLQVVLPSSIADKATLLDRALAMMVQVLVPGGESKKEGEGWVGLTKHQGGGGGPTRHCHASPATATATATATSKEVSKRSPRYRYRRVELALALTTTTDNHHHSD